MKLAKTLKRGVHYIFKGIPTQFTKVSVGVISSSSKLKGKHIVITGGGSGLGFAMAKKFVADGAIVLIVGRDELKLKKASADLNNCKFLEFDVSNHKHIVTFMSQCIGMLEGRIDVFVNNAGISLHEKGLMNVTEETYDKQFDVNLKAPYFISQAFIKHCIQVKNTNAHLLFITSERGLYCDEIPYGLIKAAINSLTKGLSCRYLSTGIRVNAIAPGVTVSEMTGYDSGGNLYRPQTIGQRVFLAEEVAEVASFVISDAAKSISGEIIPCNQGNHLRHK